MRVSRTSGSVHADPGIVYILTNAAMPTFVKIGLTRKDDVSERLKQLDTTGVPMPFEVAYSAKVPDCARLENVLHRVFGDKRARSNREFFTADPELARLIIDLVKIEELVLSDAEQGITPVERETIEAEKERRTGRLTFTDLGLAAGTVLTFLKDPNITCEVASPTKVRFRGEEVSASRAALIVLHEMGYTWGAVSGWEHWAYQGVKLAGLKPTEG
jgi:hypothetical protein